MARSADPFSGVGGDAGLQRGRGGFWRSADDAPWVSHPTETTKHPGLKADLLALCTERGIAVPDGATVPALHDLLGGKPKRVKYGSPSNLGTLIENGTNLAKWGERKVVEGLLADPSLLDVDPETANLDGIVARAKRAARADLAADRGTHVHDLTECHDRGVDWGDKITAGEVLGIDKAQQTAVVAAWSAMLAEHGLEVLEIERAVVDDEWRQAGTLDRIVRCTRELRFALPTGEIRTIPAGTVVVLDIKTGSLRLAHSVQIASYAQSVPYDTETDTRGEWEF